MQGLIFDIQGYSVHDGSGCRTLVFLGGCPLRCAWCSNPEGQLPRPRLMYHHLKCRHTHHRCVAACSRGAIRIMDGEDPHLRFDRTACERCDGMECVKACLNEALRIAGRYYAVDELMRVLTRDQEFWGSGGGVTFGGGEPLSQPEFLLEVLARCRSGYMHTTVETCAHCHTDTLLDVVGSTDAAFIDIKHMDSAAHRRGTGVGNELILANIEAAASMKRGCRLIIRVPVVPGFNDTIENMRSTASFMARLGLKEVNLLPLHRLGQSKYEQLGMSYEYAETKAPSDGALASYRGLFEAAGVQCYLGSATPF